MQEKEYHYIYKITCTKPTDLRKYYIGVHSSMCIPNKDISYMGSSEYLDSAIKSIGNQYFDKEILSVWETRVKANQEEIRLHTELDVAKDLEYFNKYNARIGDFCVYGYVTVKDIRTNRILNVTKDEYYQSITVGKVVVYDRKLKINCQIETETFKSNKDRYISVNKNKIIVIDKKTEQIKSIDKDNYIENKENYEKYNVGKLVVKDTRDNSRKLVTKEEYKQCEYYVGNTKGQVTVRSLKTGETKNVSLYEFENNSDLVTVNSNVVKFYNRNDELQFISDCQIDNFLKKHNMPVNAFKVSYRNNGTKLYLKRTNKSNWSTIVKKEHNIFKGWYALRDG